MKKAFVLIGSLLSLFFLYMKTAAAHCPLCTAGAAVAAAGATYLGVDKIVISLFIGAFAVSTGWWMARKIPRRYVPYQTHLLIVAAFALTVIPILPILSHPTPFYISLAGGYGSLLNRTYIYDASLATALLGGLTVSITPRISSFVTGLRNGEHVPFQGILLTFMILIFTGIILQVV